MQHMLWAVRKRVHKLKNKLLEEAEHSSLHYWLSKIANEIAALSLEQLLLQIAMTCKIKNIGEQ